MHAVLSEFDDFLPAFSFGPAPKCAQCEAPAFGAFGFSSGGSDPENDVFPLEENFFCKRHFLREERGKIAERHQRAREIEEDRLYQVKKMREFREDPRNWIKKEEKKS